MIVYGSPQRTVATSAALAAVYHLAQRAPTEPHADTTRRLLLALGELAQGVADAPDPAPVTVQGLHAALLLVGTALYEQQEPESPGATHAQLNRAFAAVAALTTLPVPPQITIHQPEGFAFYGLYPERYFHAVQAGPLWQMDPALAVCVIGIRSIGTALAAAVGGALAARGATVHVTSVRPSGHPFARELVLDGELLRGIAASAFTAYVVVDEGPGLSGSSFAAVGRALLDAGVAGDAIYFFPAHGHGPGSAAGPTVRAVWDAVRVGPPTSGRSAFQPIRLARRLARTPPAPSPRARLGRSAAVRAPRLDFRGDRRPTRHPALLRGTGGIRRNSPTAGRSHGAGGLCAAGHRLEPRLAGNALAR